ncbi:MAG: 4-hydroxy-tetrahydrodipicolinate reductase [Hadesarchaea archaeon]|nr:4-hydroxy-tetrahydrodipicolinate reductase [Hadesarchaea archaeon]
MIKVAVCGACGRMGKEIVRAVSNQEDMKVVAAIDAPGTTLEGQDIGEVAGIGKLGVKVVGADKIAEVLNEARPDVLVDFTVAEAAVQNVKAAAKAKVGVVVGTTGLSKDQMEELKEAVRRENISAVVSSNMSVGVNVFFKLAEEAGRLLKDYDIEIIEAHHRKKIDAPSGTALKVAQIIAESSGRDFEDVARFGRPRGKLGERPTGEIGIHSIRGGGIVGEHTVIFAGPEERLELVHRAQSRRVFASGTVRAIRHVAKGSKPGTVQSMQDVIFGETA